LEWLVELRPRDLLAAPQVRAAVGAVIPPSRFDAFAAGHGGVDLRAAEQLVVARYGLTTLFIVRAPIDPARVEAALSARADSVDARTVDHGVVRLAASVRGEPTQLAILGREGVALERGRPGPLVAAVYFAQRRLHRAEPALRAEPLAAAATLAGEAPLRAFAAGPFEGEWASAAAGLFRATTAVTVAARPEASAGSTSRGLAVRLVLTGAWGEDAPAAAERLGAAFGVLAADPLGRLLGIDRPLDGPVVSGRPGALELAVALDVVALARGLHAAADATLAEMMSD
ncbi:MAG TPA: hypothetical protein VE987_20435, partial [Polyangiaceae bacterium]|nr:hypothetical protein [Polyangiaceae bacterium]